MNLKPLLNLQAGRARLPGNYRRETETPSSLII